MLLVRVRSLPIFQAGKATEVLASVDAGKRLARKKDGAAASVDVDKGGCKYYGVSHCRYDWSIPASKYAGNSAGEVPNPAGSTGRPWPALHLNIKLYHILRLVL